jgi:predicted Rossmann-fold nucleotide-binding protein
MLVSINAEDLHDVVEFWRSMDNMVGERSIKKFFKTSVEDICSHPIQKRTFELFQRRPHITGHAGSKSGSNICADIVQECAYQTGWLSAQHGFNFWYGGGDSGLMGKMYQGFAEYITQNDAQPDQYCIQIIPAAFALPREKAEGQLRPANEGLTAKTDGAIIMPDFVTRRELLDYRPIAAISNPGGTGSIDEWTDMVVLTKTGLRDIAHYTLNPFIPALGRGYYDLLREMVTQFVQCGLENPDLPEKLKFVPTAAEAFKDLNKNLAARNALPNQVYNNYCERTGAKAGIPLNCG